MRLSSSSLGQQMASQVSAYELESPYTLVITCLMSVQENPYDDNLVSVSFRMDVTRDDIARELRRWLDGVIIDNPSCAASKLVESSMIKYVKLGNIPSRDILVQWILSRSEVTKGFRPGAAMCFLGGKLKADDLDDGEDLENYCDPSIHQNPFSRTAEAALEVKRAPLSPRGPHRRSADQSPSDKNPFLPRPLSASDSIEVPDMRSLRPTSAPAGQRSKHEGGEVYNSFEMTRKMLGKSQALSELKQGKVKGRSDAATIVSKAPFTEDHYRLGALIERSRKFAEQGNLVHH